MTDNNDSIEIKTTVTIKRERIAELLICGLEGGTNYWAVILDFVEPPKDSDLFEGFDKQEMLGQEVFRHVHYPMCRAGGGVLIGDTNVRDPYSEDADFQPVLLDWAALQRGLQLLAQKSPRHFADFMAENEDAETGDVFVQYAVLGEQVFA